MKPYPFPLRLPLAMDPRFGRTSLVDDHIWLLTAGEGDPAALSIETSYGHRAQQMRFYPAFRWRGLSRVDPAEFAEPVSVLVMLPNYIQLSFVPFVDLAVTMEYWVVHSQCLAGRISLRNLSNEIEEHQLRLHAQLRPGEPGNAMAAHEYLGVDVLQGKTASLNPLLFLSGGAVAERVSIPALRISNRLPPGETVTLFWATMACDKPEQAFQELRNLADNRWQAEAARIQLANSGLVEIETGDQAWDVAFMRSQQVALSLTVSNSTYLPHSSFVTQRLPDHGFSKSNSGKDQPEAWAGQDVYAAHRLAGNLLPVSPEQVEAMLRNYIHVQSAHGHIDGKPGVAGQRAGYNAPPLLAGLAWRIYLRTGSESFLREVYPPLQSFLKSWFRKERDKDKDGAPEWETPLQLGLTESPTFTRWADWSEAVDIRTVESPDLLAYLLHECQSLVRIADVLGRSEDLPDLETRATGLRRSLARGWSKKVGGYLPVDRDINLPLEGKQLAKGKGSFSKKIGRKFDPMVRLVVRSWGPETEARKMTVTVFGRGLKGQFCNERLDQGSFDWFWDFGSATTKNTFASIDRIEVSSPSKKFSTQVAIVNHHRLEASWLLPMWSKMVEAEKKESLVEMACSDQFLREHGLSSIPAEDKLFGNADHLEVWGVQIAMNERLGEALMEMGHQQEAADLVSRLMNVISGNLATEGCFREVYHPDEPSTAGARDTAFGLAPLDLFLRTLGIGLETPWSIRVQGVNPYPWPITVRWRGLTIHRPLDDFGWVEYPDGERIMIENDEPQRVERVR